MKCQAARLADLTWTQAREWFARTPPPVVVIPLGAGAKEHGPHLPLDTDLRQAEALASRLLACAPTELIVAPPITYGYYPAFVDYPGSTSVGESTMRDLVVDIVRSLARHGPRAFYVVNIGVSTTKPLGAARDLLASEGVRLSFFDYASPEVVAIEESVRSQREGSHADELETSVMLALDASRVDMSQAVGEYGPGKAPRGPFSPSAEGARPSPSGIYGDATLATREKGEALLDGYLQVCVAQVKLLSM